MDAPHLDVIYPLDILSAHSENDYLDARLFIPPWSSDGLLVQRRIWLTAPAGEPLLSFEEVLLAPKKVHAGPQRWLDYGVVEIPTGWSTQFRITGITPEACHDAHLIVSENLDLSLAGCSLADAERAILGIARCDAGRTALWPYRVEAGQPATFTLLYTAGAQGLPAGYLLRFTLPRMFSRPQMTDPDAPGYLQVRASDCALELDSIDLCYASHEKVDIIFRLGSPLPPGGRAELQYHTVQTYLVASQWGNEEMPFWYSLVPVLTASVSTGSRERWTWLARGNGHTVEYLPGPAERLHLFLPGRRHAGEPLVLKGTVTDRYRNTPRMRSPLDFDFDLYLRSGNQEIPLDRSSLRLVAHHRFEAALPDLEAGIYRVEARRKDSGAVLAISNPLEVMHHHDPRPPIYWGEIHTHTEMSDGYGDFAEMYRHARDEGAMDFVSAADHMNSFSDNDWLLMQDKANAFDDPGRFCALIGYEWGDRCVYTSRDRLPLARTMAERTPRILMEAYKGDPDIVVGPHAPLAHNLTWVDHDPDVQRFIEIYSTWGANDFRESPLVHPWTEKRGMTVNDILQTGARLGFTGGGDIHCGRAGFSNDATGGQGTVPHDLYYLHLFRDGMTAALTDCLDRDHLIQAIRNRQTYATTGARILLDFAIGDLLMGQEGAVDTIACRVTVHADDTLTAVHIVKDGTVAWTCQLSDLDASLTWTDPSPAPGDHYYYVNVVQANGEMAWSSPIWVRCP